MPQIMMVDKSLAVGAATKAKESDNVGVRRNK